MTLPHANSPELAIGHGEPAIDFEDDFHPPPVPPTHARLGIGTAPLFALNTALPQSPVPLPLPRPPLTGLIPPSFALPPPPLFSSLFNPASPFNPAATPFAPVLGPPLAPITITCALDLWSTSSAAASRTKKEAEELTLGLTLIPEANAHFREIGCTSLRIRDGFHVGKPDGDRREHLTVDKLDRDGRKLETSLHVYRAGKEPRYSLYPPTERRRSSASSRRSSTSTNLERTPSIGGVQRQPSGSGGLLRQGSSRRGSRARGGSMGGRSTGGGSRPGSEVGGGSSQA